jgi:hypothetical protein
VDGLVPCARNGHGLETTPYRPDSNTLFAVYYVDGCAAYITLSPKKLSGGEHVAPLVARELQEKGFPPARSRA